MNLLRWLFSKVRHAAEPHPELSRFPIPPFEDAAAEALRALAEQAAPDWIVMFETGAPLPGPGLHRVRLELRGETAHLHSALGPRWALVDGRGELRMQERTLALASEDVRRLRERLPDAPEAWPPAPPAEVTCHVPCAMLLARRRPRGHWLGLLNAGAGSRHPAYFLGHALLDLLPHEELEADDPQPPKPETAVTRRSRELRELDQRDLSQAEEAEARGDLDAALATYDRLTRARPDSVAGLTAAQRAERLRAARRDDAPSG